MIWHYTQKKSNYSLPLVQSNQTICAPMLLISNTEEWTHYLPAMQKNLAEVTNFPEFVTGKAISGFLVQNLSLHLLFTLVDKWLRPTKFKISQQPA